MKHKKWGTVLCLLLLTNSLSAQESFKDYHSGLTAVVNAFTEWITAAERLAQTNDREKFKSIGIDLYRDIDRTMQAKTDLIEKISSNKNKKNEYAAEVDEIWKRVKALQETLAKSEKLTKAMGMDAVKLSQNVSLDMVRKQGLLKSVKEAEGDNILQKNELIIRNLSEGVKLLTIAKSKIDAFIIKMEKQ